MRAAHLDLQDGIAIYSVYGEYAGPRSLHALQLKTGKDVSLGRGVGPYPYTQGDHGQIDRLGVVYVGEQLARHTAGATSFLLQWCVCSRQSLKVT